MPWPSVDSAQATVPHTSAASSPLSPTHSPSLLGWCIRRKEEKEGLWVEAYLQAMIAILQTFESLWPLQMRTLCSGGRRGLQVTALHLTLGEGGGATANPGCSATGSQCHWDDDSHRVRASPKGVHWLQAPACLCCCFYLGWVRHDPEGSVTH